MGAFSSTLSQLVANSNVPFFRVAYARMLQDGRWLVADEAKFLNIYSELAGSYIDAAWLLADYYITQIDLGKNAYRATVPKIDSY